MQNRRRAFFSKSNPMKGKISEHITYEEATVSGTADRLGIDNTPREEVVEVMKRTAAMVYEPLINHFDCRIAITSFFRCPKVNSELERNPNIMASKKSRHMFGEAMDINGNVYGRVTNRQIFDWIQENVDFDQLIWEDLNGGQEPEWIHVSVKTGDGAKNRKEILKRFREGDKTRYEKMSKENIRQEILTNLNTKENAS